jgi:hypothetical protein
MDTNKLGKMGKVAAECLKKPGRPSFWVEREGRYICPEEGDLRHVTNQTTQTSLSTAERIDPKFKLVFLTAAIGTFLFTLICVAVHLLTNGELPPGRKELSDSLLTMAKVGFGAVAGMLGGKAF